jgi:hypothetical protein
LTLYSAFSASCLAFSSIICLNFAMIQPQISWSIIFYRRYEIFNSLLVHIHSAKKNM